MSRYGALLLVAFLGFCVTAPADPVRSPRVVVVNALYFAPLADGGATGGTNQVRIAVEESPSKSFHVGIFENEVAGAGPMWRNTGWLASVVAAGFVDLDLANARISFELDRSVDGPSAGGLITVGLVAAVRGDKLRPEVTMTGTINPDGSIGLVGGIPHKIEGAAKAGIKRVLIPAGQRIQHDHNQKKDVDLIAHGKKHGVEVREVGDLYAAYQLMTGKELTPMAPNEAPEIADEKAYERIRTKTEEWLARYKKAQDEFAKLPDETKPESFKESEAEAKKFAELAARLLQQGVVGGAWAKAREATFTISSALQGTRLIGTYKKKGKEGAIAALKALDAAREKEKTGLEDRIAQRKPKTLGEAGAVLSAWASLWESVAFKRIAEGYLEKATAEKEPGVPLGMAAVFFEYAAETAIVAGDHIDIGTGLGGPPLPESVPVARVASFYRQVGKANLNLLDVLVIDPKAEERGRRLDEQREILLKSDPMSALAWLSMVVAERLSGAEAGAEMDYASLGAVLTGYSAACTVVAKFTSLDCKLGELFEPTEIGNERILLNMLELADTQARRSITFLRQHKADTTSLVVAYESARMRREGGLVEKFEALRDYWQLQAQARALAYLGGLVGKDATARP